MRRTQAELARRLRVSADGRPLSLVAGTPALALRPGAGGLQTTRFEFSLGAAVQARRVEVRDDTYPDRVGWRAIVARPGRGTAVRSSVPAIDRPAPSPATRWTRSRARPTSARRVWTCAPGRER